MKSSTIIDVAKRADVSIKTVSRVINDAPNVSAGVRDRVEAAIAALNYRPNPAARSLSGRRNYLIGLVYWEPVSDYIGKLQQGAIGRCRKSGYNLLLEPIEAGDTGPVAEMIARLKVDGLILVPPIGDDPLTLSLLDRAKIPYVRISPQQDDYRSAFVTMDDELAAFQMTGYLIAQGHRRIAFVEGRQGHFASIQRLAGYRRALREAGIEVPAGYVQPGYFDFRTGYAAAEALLALPERPTAIFAANDECAIGVLARARRHGLDVPDDLSICGFDDSILCTTVWPELTTVRQPVIEMARLAAEYLIEGRSKEIMGDGRALHRTLDFELVLRQSTGMPPAA